MDSIRPGNNGNFLYRPLETLPLEGPDYGFKVERRQNRYNYEIQKRGNEITVDHFNNEKDIKISVNPDEIRIDAYGTANDVIIKKGNDKIFIDRVGFNDVSIEKKGNVIEVNRSDSNQNITFVKNPSGGMQIDRYGYQNDVNILKNGESVYIDKYSDANDVKITRTGGVNTLDPNCWHEDFTISPEGWALVNGWFTHGLKAEDLIALSEDGNVHLLDNELF